MTRLKPYSAGVEKNRMHLEGMPSCRTAKPCVGDRRVPSGGHFRHPSGGAFHHAGIHFCDAVNTAEAGVDVFSGGSAMYRQTEALRSRASVVVIAEALVRPLKSRSRPRIRLAIVAVRP